MALHQLTEVSIQNFKSCNKCSLHLAAYTPIVGYNNAGKSNILEAIAWLIRPSALGHASFNDPDSPIIVEGRVEGINEDILTRIGQTHRNKITPFCVGESMRFRRIQQSPTTTAKSIGLYIRDPTIDDDDAVDAWKNPTGIPNAIGALFPDPISISAMDDATEDIAKYKTSTTIGKLIAKLIAPIQDQHGQTLATTLSELSNKFHHDGSDRLQALNDFDSSVNTIVEDFFPGVETRVHIPTPIVKEIFQQGTIKVRDSCDGDFRDASSLGHGTQRSIQMALVRKLAETGRAERDAAAGRTLLLIDEPELYLHPNAIQQVCDALRNLSILDYQIVFATHSPLAIGREDLPHTQIVRKDDNNSTITSKRLATAIEEAIEDADVQAQILLELSNASQILFADQVIMGEGKTEERLIPHLYEKLTGHNLAFDKNAFVALDGGGSTSKMLTILEAMSVPAKSVVDLDFGFREAVSGGYLQDDDADLEACKQILIDLAANDDGITLDEQGLPTRSDSYTAAEIFEKLAADARAQSHIVNLHDKLRASDIWLWTKGTIEIHLGIEGKRERVWARYAQRLHSQAPDSVIDDFDFVQDCIRWMQPPHTIPEEQTE